MTIVEAHSSILTADAQERDLHRGAGKGIEPGPVDCRTAGRRTTIWATPHPLRRTLSELRRTLSELRRTLFWLNPNHLV